MVNLAFYHVNGRTSSHPERKRMKRLLLPLQPYVSADQILRKLVGFGQHPCFTGSLFSRGSLMKPYLFLLVFKSIPAWDGSWMFARVKMVSSFALLATFPSQRPLNGFSFFIVHLWLGSTRMLSTRKSLQAFPLQFVS